ncbi:MAG: LapA family protein [Gammaproteobacteria bacterium]|jgi:putative membrane protein
MSQLIKKILYISLFVITLVIALLFFVKNYQVLEFNYILGVIELPLSMLMLIGFIFGLVIGILAMLPMIFRLKHTQNRLKKQIRINEKEITNLRVMPARDSD